MVNDLDGQIDYLEQFGSSRVRVSLPPENKLKLEVDSNTCKRLNPFCFQFKESALRKQSLYLKFDPLLKESPKKLAAPATTAAPLPRPVALFTEYVTRSSAAAAAEG